MLVMIILKDQEKKIIVYENKEIDYFKNGQILKKGVVVKEIVLGCFKGFHNF